MDEDPAKHSLQRIYRDSDLFRGVWEQQPSSFTRTLRNYGFLAHLGRAGRSRPSRLAPAPRLRGRRRALDATVKRGTAPMAATDADRSRSSIRRARNLCGPKPGDDAIRMPQPDRRAGGLGGALRPVREYGRCDRRHPECIFAGQRPGCLVFGAHGVSFLTFSGAVSHRVSFSAPVSHFRSSRTA